MSVSDTSSECQALIEACTLALYQKNIFRITGLPVDATPKDVSRQAQKLQMMEEVSGTPLAQPAFSLVSRPTSEQIRGALARIKEPESRLVDEFFWYWPETFGDSKNDVGIQAVLAGDKQNAMAVWIEQERRGSRTAKHNLAVMYHMSALDWTNHQFGSDLDERRDDKIKEYWRDAFGRWEELADSDRLWEIVKERVRSLNDEALTLGFLRRMRRALPQAFDKINAEAALKFAEQGRMDWAGFHVDLMRQTHQGLDDVDGTAETVLAPTKKRVEQRVRAASDEARKAPEAGAQVATDLMRDCRPLMALFDLFHGADSHQRGDLFDGVAETVAQAVIDYQRATEDDHAFVQILEQALVFATGIDIRERLLKNISIGKGNLDWQHLKPIFDSIRRIAESAGTPSGKLQQMQNSIFPQLPILATRLENKGDAYRELMDTISITLRELSISAHNENRDFSTAEKCINLAVKFAQSPEVKSRIQDDIKALNESKDSYKCSVCKVNQAAPHAALRVSLSKLPSHLHSELSKEDRSRGWIEIPRCPSCRSKQDAIASGGGAGCVIALLTPLGFLGIILIGTIIIYF